MNGTALTSAVDIGQCNGETGSHTGLAFNSNASAHHVDKTLTNRQTQSGATEALANRLIRLGEGFEQAIDFDLNDEWSLAVLAVGKFNEDVRIVTQRSDDPSSRQEFQDSSDYDMGPKLRPGGGLIAYVSGSPMTGEAQVFVRRFPEGSGRWQASRRKAFDPVWSRDGTRLYFLEGERPKRTLMELPVTLEGDRVVLGEAVPLFEVESGFSGNFDAAMLAFQGAVGSGGLAGLISMAP